jgi:hypothetical protein
MRKQFLFIAAVAAFLAAPVLVSAHTYRAAGAGGIPAIESTAPNAVTPAQAKRAEAAKVKNDSANKAETLAGMTDAANGNG